MRDRDGVGELGRGRQQPRDEILLGRRQGGAVGQANEAWLARAAALGLRADGAGRGIAAAVAAGPRNRPRPGRAPRLDAGRREKPRKLVPEGPYVEATGLSAWTLPELCCEVERRWNVAYHPDHVSKAVRALGLSRQKARSLHQGGRGGAGAVRKTGL